MLQTSNNPWNRGASPGSVLQDAQSPRTEVAAKAVAAPRGLSPPPLSSLGCLQPRISQGEIWGLAQEQMVSLVGPICQATLEQLLSAVPSRILFTFPSCQQGDV